MQIEDHYEIEDLEQAEDLQRQGYFTDQTLSLIHISEPTRPY